MATTLTGKVQLNYNWDYRSTNTGLSDVSQADSFSKIWTFTSGTAALQCDEIYAATRTLAGGASETLDLAGSLTNFFGTTITFLSVKIMIVRLLSTSDDATNGTAATHIIVGNAASNQFLGPLGAAAHTFEVRNGGFAAFAYSTGQANGWTVTAGSVDNLKVLNGDASVTAAYQIVLAGDKT